MACDAVNESFARFSAFLGSTGRYAYEARQSTNARMSGSSPEASPSAALSNRKPRSCSDVSFGCALWCFGPPAEGGVCGKHWRDAKINETNSRELRLERENRESRNLRMVPTQSEIIVNSSNADRIHASDASTLCTNLEGEDGKASNNLPYSWRFGCKLPPASHFALERP